MALPANTTSQLRNFTVRRASLCVAPGFNVRFDMGDLEALAQSIALHGIERTLVVERVATPASAEQVFEVTDGHRRLAAFDLAVTKGLVDAATFDIPVEIKAKSSDEERLGMMARSNDGKPLLPMEEAALYKRLQDIFTAKGFAVTAGIEEICKVVGRHWHHVRDRLSLLTAAPEIQEAVKAGAIRATFAQQIIAASKQGLKKNDTEAIAARQRELLAEAGTVEGKKQVRTRVDGQARKQRALSMKVAQVEAALADISTKVRDAIDASGMTRKQIKDQVGADLFEIIKYIGAESTLKAIVRGATAEE